MYHMFKVLKVVHLNLGMAKLARLSCSSVVERQNGKRKGAALFESCWENMEDVSPDENLCLGNFCVLGNFCYSPLETECCQNCFGTILTIERPWRTNPRESCKQIRWVCYNFPSLAALVMVETRKQLIFCLKSVLHCFCFIYLNHQQAFNTSLPVRKMGIFFRTIKNKENHQGLSLHKLFLV